MGDLTTLTAIGMMCVCQSRTSLECMMGPDNDAFAELDAMKAVATAVEKVEGEEARGRVLRWACERYGVAGIHKARSRSDVGSASESKPEEPGSQPDYESAAELLAHSGADTDTDKTLVVGYWFQRILNQGDLEAQTLNTELKHLGHGVGNITRALDNLMKQKPQLVIQLRKSGTSKQARKKYKITNAGILRVQQMLDGEHEQLNES